MQWFRFDFNVQIKRSSSSILPENELIILRFIQPWFAKTLKIHDTCGVHNLHGMPAIIGALLSCVMAALATKEAYGDSDEGYVLSI